MVGSGRALGTWLGVLSILFWSTSVAFGRGLIERLGVFTATSTVFTASGVLLCLLALSRMREPRRLVAFPGPTCWSVAGFSPATSCACTERSPRRPAGSR